MTAAAIIDTSVLIDATHPAVRSGLPAEIAVSTISLAELSAGVHQATTAVERGRRQALLQYVETAFISLPFDAAEAASYGLLVGAVLAVGRSHRSRIADLLIAATAHANGLPVYTRNPDDLRGLGDLVDVVTI
ncbi:MAG: type II toxin-antitoxin system VapC family toxin [Candidatus Dormibacteraceae bacterium]